MSDDQVGEAEITDVPVTFDESGLCQTLREYWHFAEGAESPPPGWGS